MLLKNVFIEGPDCSGKTTVINSIHKNTNYKYHMFDRSRMSQYLFSVMYERTDLKWSKDLYHQELCDLSNLYVVLLPDLDVVLDRFQKRGDEIHDKSGIESVYFNFKKFAIEESRFPNVIVIRDSENQWKDVLNAIEKYESKKEYEVAKEFVYAKSSKESVGLKISEIGSLNDLKKDYNCMKFKKEKEYYETIEKQFIQKFVNETTGDNEYSRKELYDSRRFIFVSDTCISSIHAICRDGKITFQAYMRSSNVDQVRHDYNFIRNLVIVFKNLLLGSSSIPFDLEAYQLDLLFGSAHVVQT
jgi:thymidylate kinase